MSEQPKPRKRPGRASEAFGRLANATQANPVPGGEPVADPAPWRPDAVAPPAAAPTGKPVRRFNIRVYDQGDSDAIDRWTTYLRGQLGGGKVDVARTVRELLREAAEDPVLSDRIVSRLREDERPATKGRTFV